MKIETLLETEFHHDGRGPELQRAVWSDSGVILKGFEYFNPEDVYASAMAALLSLVSDNALESEFGEIAALWAD